MLEIYNQLFTQLNADKISYCSWKNNHLLLRACNGDGDIDLLVSPAEHSKFNRILRKLGFIMVKSAISEYPSIQHYYCYDALTDHFGHLHVYFKLITGDSHLKNYRIPFERKVLANSIFNESGVKEAHPNHQLELYKIRNHIKASSFLGRFLLKREEEDYQLELNYILSNIDKNISHVELLLTNFSKKIPNKPIISSLIYAILNLWIWKRDVGILERVSQIYLRILNKFFFHRKKTINGAIISIVGLDGSGKSSSVNELNKWLVKEFTSKKFHFGRPPPIFITYPFRLLLKLRKLFKNSNSVASLKDTSNSYMSLLSKIRYLVLAFERASLIKKAHRFALNGGIAILDRYPSNNLGKMDSKRISDEKSFIGIIESNLYDRMKITDVLIKLNVDVEEAVVRNKLRNKKDKETDNEIRIRFEINAKLDYEALIEYEVDSMQSINEVHQQIKNLIWGYIIASN